MPFPPYPVTPQPITWAKGNLGNAAQLRSDVENATLLLTQPPVFSGAQTGLISAYTASAASDLFTAPGTAYANGQPVLLNITTGTGGFTTGTVYYTLNVSGDQFNLSTSGSGGIHNITTNGTGTVQQTQVISSSTTVWTPVNLDTEISDVWQSHLTTSNPPASYAMLPGLYLAEFTAAPLYSGGSGTVSAGITAQQGTGQPTTIGGARMPNSASSGHYPQPAAVKLLSFSVAGNYGAAGNNYASGAIFQDSGSDVTPLATATRYAQLNLEWVSALSGDPLSPVPDNDAWAVPPDPVTAAFLNKNVRDTARFLALRPCVEAVYAAGSFSLASATSLPSVGVTIPLDTVNTDNRATATQAQFSTGTSTWTCLYPGIYDFYGQHAVNGATTAVAIAAGLTVASVNYNSGSAFTVWSPAQVACTSSSAVSSALVRRRLRLAYGDTVKLAGWQNNSSAASATVPSGNWKPRLIAIWRAR